MVRVLFVCLGNICRSPMAEAVFRHLVEREGLADRIAVVFGGEVAGELPVDEADPERLGLLMMGHRA